MLESKINNTKNNKNKIVCFFSSFFLKKRLERKACSLVKGNERRAGSKKRQIRAVEFMP